MDNRPSDLRSYARGLAEELGRTFRIDAADRLAHAFIFHAARLGLSDYEDFGQLVLLECLAERSELGALDVEGVTRVMDRVRHRLARQAAKARATRHYQDQLLADPTQYEALQARETSDRVRDLLAAAAKTLTPLHLEIVRWHYLEGESLREIGRRLNLGLTRVHRMKEEAVRAIRKAASGQG